MPSQTIALTKHALLYRNNEEGTYIIIPKQQVDNKETDIAKGFHFFMNIHLINGISPVTNNY